ncbi:TrkH family potassium uptake protein [Catalinimonas niigatensis]|uniref:TrkH family potassium uptake protein n=1 Tax=Catalinimonas niigatensis TaxID=1397264 RepID=UPI002665A453|nr:TrkH family potassium uptake protein [Catalinimonas niigatensis]WPP47952.1 TrkH family potassium uptake protein [Catalinimonas niigatensis]
MKFNWKVLLNIQGVLLMFNGAFMLLGLLISFFYEQSGWKGILAAAGVSFLTGLITWLATRKQKNKELRSKDGYLVVTLAWILMSFFGSLPYVFSGTIPSYPDAFFESMSGFTTTGATILTDIEALPKDILFWRSLTQWIGGMGIIVLAVAILPILGIGGMQLFVAEAPGVTPDKLKPRIRDTAKRLWFLYIGLTLLETVLLMLGGMNFYDSINHGLTTMATGGFSPKNASIAFYDSAYLQYVITVFMFLAGTSFSLTYFAFKGAFNKVWQNEEFRYYMFSVLIIILLSTIGIYTISDVGLEKSFRDAAFQVVSVISTTGFITADYTSWAPVMTVIFFLLMFIGGSAGSTAGGVKVVRHIVLLKNSVLEMKRQVHPSAIIPVRLNGKAITQDITFNVLAFFIIYITIFALGSITMALIGVDFMTAIGAVATSLGNVGPGLGTVGPVDNFAHLPAAAKWVLSFLMLLGRLELFTVLILLTPYFWNRNV